MLSIAFRKLSRSLLPFYIPLVLDLFSFLTGVMMIGFSGGSKISFKLSLDAGLPTVESIVDRSFMPNGIHFSTNGPGTPLIMIVIGICFLLVRAFANGGFMGLLKVMAEESRPTMEDFFDSAKRYFGRFLGLQILIFAFTIIVGGLLVLVFQIFGVLLFAVVYIWLRSLFIYVESTIVVDNCSLNESFIRARVYFSRSQSDTIQIIFSIILVGFLLGLIINGAWSPIVFLISLVLYDFLVTGFQFALMLTLYRIR